MVLKFNAKTALIAMLFVTACGPQIPDSNPDAGPGFTDYTTYERARILEEQGRLNPGDPANLPLAGGSAPVSNEGDPALAAGAVADGGPRVIGDPGSERASDRGNAEISDEQDFQAVSERETIESDAERIARNRERYEQVQPSALPQRAGGSRPNIVAFALSTNNPVGEQLYRRTNLLGQGRSERNCARYASPDAAQEAFLGAGGPERDRMGVDPDGDGFACHWDPTPYRNARGASN